MFAHHSRTVFLIAGFVGVATALSDEVVPSAPPATQGGVQVLPIPPRSKTPGALEGALSDPLSSPAPGLYTSEPWSLIIKVPEAIDTSMPTVIPPQRGHTIRTIEPAVRLVPRKSAPQGK
ncbi:hypothetical protein ACXR0O_18975 [Verrucomicrobiota bacterium sgz303538]